MRAALDTLLDKKEKAQGESLGGEGILTQEKIKITSYCGYALRSHRNNVPGMQKVVQATLKHMSMDAAPRHDLCPKGPESWCKYNRVGPRTRSPHHTRTGCLNSSVRYWRLCLGGLMTKPRWSGAVMGSHKSPAKAWTL